MNKIGFYTEPATPPHVIDPHQCPPQLTEQEWLEQHNLLEIEEEDVFETS